MYQKIDLTNTNTNLSNFVYSLNQKLKEYNPHDLRVTWDFSQPFQGWGSKLGYREHIFIHWDSGKDVSQFHQIVKGILDEIISTIGKDSGLEIWEPVTEI